MIMPDVNVRIKELEREIERVKSQFSLGRMSLVLSKKRVLALEKELAMHVKKLPEHQREIYLLRKEFGKEF
jgi:hypothetical protein